MSVEWDPASIERDIFAEFTHIGGIDNVDVVVVVEEADDAIVLRRK